MKILLSIVCLLLTACRQTTAPTVAIRDATVVDVVDGSLRPEQTVLIAGKRIVAVGPTAQLRIPDAADLVEAAGGYLIPGMWDMHVHSVANVTWDMDVRSIGNAEWHFPLFLAYGVTGVRNVNDATADPTLKVVRSVKHRLAKGDLVGPRLLANGPAIDGDPPLTSNPVVVRTAAEARAVVDTLVDHGADFVKVYTNLSREAYFAIIDQARQRGIPVGARTCAGRSRRPPRAAPGTARGQPCQGAKATASLRTYLVDQNSASWNRVAAWLRQIEGMHRTP